jgi:hypothetical protein
MFSATFYFLGAAAFIVSATACLTIGKRMSRNAKVDISDLREASLSVLTSGQNPTWDQVRALWIKWYARCQEKAVLKQKAIYSWARTLALCAMLCIIGVLLENEFDEPISFSRILAGFRSLRPAATAVEMPHIQKDSTGHAGK